MQKVNSVPIETTTLEWLESSAKFAYLFWRAGRLRENVNETAAERQLAWDTIAPAYRAYVRSALRDLHNEGIVIENCPIESQLYSESDEWRIKSGRAAWIFWHKWQRTTHRKSSKLALLEWKGLATEYREFFRKFLRQLTAEGVSIKEY